MAVVANVEDVQVRTCVQEIVKHDLEIKAFIQDIRQLVTTEQDLSDMNLKIREKLAVLRSRIEDLAQLAREQDRDFDRINILQEVEKYRKQLHSTQTSLRRANLARKLSMEKTEKEELLHGGTGDSELRKRNNKENLVKMANNITENLVSISRIMDSSVKQSGETMQNLVNSSAKVTETREEFKGMKGVIQGTRNLLTKYNRRQLTDKLLIMLALALFFATVLYILKKRIF